MHGLGIDRSFLVSLGFTLGNQSMLLICQIADTIPQYPQYPSAVNKGAEWRPLASWPVSIHGGTVKFCGCGHKP